MSKKKTDKRKFKDTKVGMWLKEHAPDILSGVSELTPDAGLLGVVASAIEGKKVDPAAELEFHRLLMEEEIAAQEQVTRRWEADAKADVKLAKYVRPVTLITLTVFFMIITIWDGLSTSFMPPENYIDLLQYLMMLVFGAYYSGRTIEKIRTVQ